MPDDDPIPVRLPHSEVCVHLQVAGQVRPVQIVGSEHKMAQICYPDGTPFSFPVTLGEAGVLAVAEARQERQRAREALLRHRAPACCPCPEGTCARGIALTIACVVADAEVAAAEARALR